MLSGTSNFRAAGVASRERGAVGTVPVVAVGPARVCPVVFSLDLDAVWLPALPRPLAWGKKGPFHGHPQPVSQYSCTCEENEFIP